MASVGVGNSDLPQKYERIRHLIEKHDVFQWLFLGLVCSFFVLDTTYHRLYFYVGVIVPFLVFARRDVIFSIFALPLWRFAAVYLVYLWMTLFWSTEFSLFGLFNQTRLLFMVLFFITFTLYLVLEDPEFPGRILRYFAWAGVAGACAALLYHLAFAEQLLARMEGPGRAEHPIIGATLYGVAAICLLGGVLRDEARGMGKLLGWGAFLVLIAAMVLTQSRGPVLSMTLVVFLYLLATGHWKIAILLPLPAVVYFALMMTGMIEPGSWITRGSTHRFDIWVQSWDMILESTRSLLIGQGMMTEYAFNLANGSSVKSPHNLFLANQLYGGLVASVLFLGLIAITAINALRGFARSGNFVVCALLIFGLGTGLFDYRTVYINLSQEWMTFWLPFLLATAGWPQAKSDGASTG